MLKTYFSKNKTILCLAIIAAAIFLVASPALFNPFSSLDDPIQVINNPDIRSLDFPHIYKLFSSFYLGMYQPLAGLSFAIEYQVWGINASLNHLFNILLHLLNAYLIFFLACKILKKRSLALVLALIWAIQPVQVETVAWTSARSNLLMSAFYLSALLVYLRNEQRARKINYVWLVLLFILALLAKAPAITLPLSLLALDFYNDRLSIKSVLNKIPLFVLSALGAGLTLVAKNDNFSIDPSNFNWAGRITLIPLALSKYLEKFILPINLKLFYAYPETKHGFVHSPVYLSWILIIVLIACLIKFRARKLSVLGALLFTSVILPYLPFTLVNQTIIADRYLYLASFGLLLILIDLYLWLSVKIPDWQKIVRVMMIAYLLCLASLAYLRYQAWSDSIGLIEESALAAPWSGLMQYHLSQAYYAEGYYPEALAYSDYSIQLDPSNAYAYNLSANILAFDFQDYAPALSRFNQSIQLFPTCALCYYGRGQLKLITKEKVGACWDLQKATSLDSSLDQSLLKNYCRQ